MQNIATDKSEFATLPLKVGVQKSRSINQQIEFQSFLREADPIYRQPVEPKIAAVNRTPDNHSKAASTESSYDRHAQRNQRDQRQARDNQNEQRMSEGNGSQQRQSEHAGSAQVRSKQAHQSEYAKATELKNKSADKANPAGQTATSQASEASPSGAIDIVSSDTQGHKGDSDALADSLPNAKKEQLEFDGQSDIDWLSLVESSLSTDLAGNAKLDSENTMASTENSELTNLPVDLVTDDKGLIATLPSADAEQLTGSTENLLPSNLSSGDAAKELIITEQQIAADLAKLNPEQAALAKLAELLSNLSESEPSKAEIEQALAQLLDAQREQTPTTVSSHLDSSDQQLTKSVPDSDSQAILNAELLAAVALTGHNKHNQTLGSQDASADTTAALINQSALDSSPHHMHNSIDGDLKRLLDLPEQKIDAALANLADRLVTDNDKNRIAATLNSLDKLTLGTDLSAVKADFVTSLKAGIEEFKSQLQQGHQPSIDLTTLVADSFVKSTGLQVPSEQLNGTLSRFNQTLDVANLLKVHNDSAQLSTQIEKVASKDTLTQAQIVQNKQGQQIAQFDKAVNITRHEGLQQMAEKVRWMMNQNNLLAEIRLDPPDLGAMKVRINMAGDAATVSIVVQSQQAREALEQATPRLKELLEQQGIELGQSSVQQEQSDNETDQHGQFAGQRSDQQELPEDETLHMEQPIQNGRVGGIDYFV